MYGKLGHGNENGHSTPKRVEALVGLVVSQIACGSRHTAVVTSPEGNLYTWGDNEAGTTGIGSREGHQYTPKLLERLSGKRVVQLSACGFHTGCLCDAGHGGEMELYTFGEGSYKIYYFLAEESIKDYSTVTSAPNSVVEAEDTFFFQETKHVSQSSKGHT